MGQTSNYFKVDLKGFYFSLKILKFSKSHPIPDRDLLELHDQALEYKNKIISLIFHKLLFYFNDLIK